MASSWRTGDTSIHQALTSISESQKVMVTRSILLMRLSGVLELLFHVIDL